MKYISIDVETTGLLPGKHQILELAAVLGDTNEPERDILRLPYFEARFYYEELVGHPVALAMNHRLIQQIKTAEVPLNAWTRFGDWLRTHIPKVGRGWTFTPAGKNYANFDHLWIPWGGIGLEFIRPKHRVLDPGVIFWKPLDDEVIPDLKQCCQRAGIVVDEHQHEALYDARLVAQLVSFYCLACKGQRSSESTGSSESQDQQDQSTSGPGVPTGPLDEASVSVGRA